MSYYTCESCNGCGGKCDQCTATVCLNAANEEAVYAFLQGKITLLDIINTTERMLSEHNNLKNPQSHLLFSYTSPIHIILKIFVFYNLPFI